MGASLCSRDNSNDEGLVNCVVQYDKFFVLKSDYEFMEENFATPEQIFSNLKYVNNSLMKTLQILKGNYEMLEQNMCFDHEISLDSSRIPTNRTAWKDLLCRF